MPVAHPTNSIKNLLTTVAASRRIWITSLILGVLIISNLVDRNIITMLMGDIKTDLELGDFETSLAAGTAFGIFYVLCAIPFGWAADHLPRPLVLFLSVLIWSLACAGGAFASTFAILFLSRAIVGASQAAMAPCAFSIIAETYPRDKIATGIALYNVFASIGAAAGFVVGGYLVSYAGDDGISLPLFGQVGGWQFTLVAVGLPGILMAFLTFALPEPRDTRSMDPDQATPPPNVMLSPFLKRNRQLIALHFLAFALCMTVVYAGFYWVPEYLARNFGWAPTKIGQTISIIMLVSGLSGQFLSIKTIGWLNKRGHADATLRAFIIFLLIALPSAIAAFSFNSETLFVAGYFLVCIAINTLMTFGSSSLQLFVPRPLRGRMSGAFMSVMGLAGISLGPSVVGFATEFIFRDESKLGSAILTTSVVCLTLAIIVLTFALAPFRRALADVEPAKPETVTIGPEAVVTTELQGSSSKLE